MASTIRARNTTRPANSKNWWTPADYRDFQSRGKCVVDQFDSYTVDGGLHENGKLVLGEKASAISAALSSPISRSKSRCRANHDLPTKRFPPEQQFFISWGQSRGDEIRPDAQRQFVLTNPSPREQISRTRPAQQSSRVRESIQLQSRRHDGAAHREPLHHLVSDLLQVSGLDRTFRRNKMIFSRRNLDCNDCGRNVHCNRRSLS